MDAYTVLFETARPAEVEAVRRALADAAIPFRSGLMTEGPPRVVFSVPRERIALARATILAHVARFEASQAASSAEVPRVFPSEAFLDGLDEALAGDDAWSSTLEGAAAPGARASDRDDARAAADDDDLEDEADATPARFPWGAVGTALAVVVLHALLVLWTGGAFESGREALARGVLLRGGTLLEPWRLATSLALHADLRHALANGLSMTVFAVPLIERLGTRRTAWIYLLSGVGGGLTALSLARPGTAFLGSSGAVAGLFGAWAVTAFDRAAGDVLPWRSRIRTLGVALLVLPSLLTPYTPDGRPVSVASHVGGLVTGMLIGASLSGWLERVRGDDPMFDA